MACDVECTLQYAARCAAACRSAGIQNPDRLPELVHKLAAYPEDPWLFPATTVQFVRMIKADIAQLRGQSLPTRS